MEYKVATDDKPTFFNKDAALGLLVGFVALTAFPLAIPALGLTAAATALSAAGLAGVVGSIAGRSRMSRELEEGKVVKEPTAFNKKAAIGGLTGTIIGSMIASLAVTALASTVAIPILTAMAAGVVIGAVIGAFIGGKSGKAEMRREHDAAALAQAQQDRLLAIARAKQQEQFANTPLPQLTRSVVTPGAEPDQASAPPIRIVVDSDGKQPVVIPTAAQPDVAALPNNVPDNVTVISDRRQQPVITPAAFTENSPSNNTTVITAADGQPTAPAEPHTHNITTNTYTTVITATPPQPAVAQMDSGGTTINNTVLAAAESQPSATAVAQPQSDTMVVAAAQPPQSPAADTTEKSAAGTHRPTVIQITISGKPSQQLAQTDGGAEQPQADGKFTNAVLAERQQPPVTVTVQTGKGPGQSYISNLTAEREQPAVQGNTV